MHDEFPFHRGDVESGLGDRTDQQVQPLACGVQPDTVAALGDEPFLAPGAVDSPGDPSQPRSTISSRFHGRIDAVALDELALFRHEVVRCLRRASSNRSGSNPCCIRR